MVNYVRLYVKVFKKPHFTDILFNFFFVFSNISYKNKSIYDSPFVQGYLYVFIANAPHSLSLYGVYRMVIVKNKNEKTLKNKSLHRNATQKKKKKYI